MVQGIGMCGDGAVYTDGLLFDGRAYAGQCAQELAKASDGSKSYYVHCWTEDISDGLPASVNRSYCRVAADEPGKARIQDGVNPFESTVDIGDVVESVVDGILGFFGSLFEPCTGDIKCKGGMNGGCYCV